MLCRAAQGRASLKLEGEGNPRLPWLYSGTVEIPQSLGGETVGVEVGDPAKDRLPVRVRGDWDMWPAEASAPQSAAVDAAS